MAGVRGSNPVSRTPQVSKENYLVSHGQHLRDLETSRRCATLLAILLEAKATLIDQALDLHDRMIGGLFNRAKRRHAEEFQQSGEANARESSAL